MPWPIKLYKKVPKVVISHLILIFAIVTFIVYLELKDTIQLVVEHFTDNLITFIKLPHRKESIHPYDPSKESILKTRVRHMQRNKKTNWDTVISENWAMCKKAIGIIGQGTEHNDDRIEGQG